MTALSKKIRYLEKNLGLEEGGKGKKQRKKRKVSPDDYALLIFLKKNRGQKSVNLIFNHFLELLRPHFTGLGLHEKEIIQAGKQTFAKLKAAIELGAVRLPLGTPLWSIFLTLGKLEYPDYGWSVPSSNAINYLSKRCLIDLRKDYRDAVLEAITAGFREPASTDFSYTNYASVIEFEDLYQDTVMELVKKFPRQEEKHQARFYQYFKTIFFNKAADAWNKDQRNPIVSVANLNQNGDFEKEFEEKEEVRHNTEATMDSIIELYGLDELLEAKHVRQNLRRILKLMEPRCRAIISLFYFEGTSYKELAKILNIHELSVGGVKANCMRNLRRMFQQIKK